MESSLNVLGFDVSTLSPHELLSFVFSSNNKTIINTINPHSYVETKRDTLFYLALHDSDFLIPDGSGIVLACRLLYGLKINKFSGYELFISIMKHLNCNGGKVFFLGSTNEVLNLIKLNAQVDFSNVTVGTYSPPFKSSFDKLDVELFANVINEFNPDVLFVGLTAPKQEKLIHSLMGLIDVNVSCGVGAVFDFYSGRIKRPNNVWVRFHLEWLVRFIGEPKRLWKRNFISMPIYLFDLLRYFFISLVKRFKNAFF